MDPTTAITGVLTMVPALAPYAVYASAVVGVFAAIAPYLPPPAMPATGFYPFVYGVVNWLGRNVKHAANATAPVTKAS